MSCIRREITIDEYESTVTPLLRTVFQDLPASRRRNARSPFEKSGAFIPDAFETPFTPAVSSRTVIDTASRFREEHCAALATAALAIGDTEFYLLFGGATPEDSYGRWHITLEDAGDAAELAGWYDNESIIGPDTLISASGRWAALASADDHAVIGATDAGRGFLERFCSELHTTPLEQGKDYVLHGYEAWEWRLSLELRESPPGTFVPTLLAHIYGFKEAMHLLALLAEVPFKDYPEPR